jgi:histone H3/H4
MLPISHTTPATDPENPILETGVKKRKYRFKSGTVALRNIKKFQTTTNLLIQEGPFRKLVKKLQRTWECRSFTKKRLLKPSRRRWKAMSLKIQACQQARSACEAQNNTIFIADLQMLDL